jgi:hypothetical protein
MQRDPEIARLAGGAEEFLRRWVSPAPGEMNGDVFVRQQMHLSVLSRFDEIWTPDGGPLPRLGENYTYDDEKGARLIALATFAGDANSDIILSEIAAHFVRAQCAMPPRLRTYMTRKLEAEWVTGKPWPKIRRRGRRRNGNARRDFGIAVAMSVLVKKGLPIESCRAQLSASSVVADALTNLGITLDDRSVVRIWKRSRQHADLWAADEFPVWL